MKLCYRICNFSRARKLDVFTDVVIDRIEDVGLMRLNLCSLATFLLAAGPSPSLALSMDSH